MKQQILPNLDSTISIFISAYRKAYGTQHVPIRLIEDWRANLIRILLWPRFKQLQSKVAFQLKKDVESHYSDMIDETQIIRRNFEKY